MNGYWIEDAERVHDEPGWSKLIGECDRGDLWVWGGSRWVHFSRWNVRHLLAFFRSKRQGRVVWLEANA